MNKENYDLKMQKVISLLNNRKPKLLLHCCCAPCSTACIERVKDLFDITAYFYNPNIDTENEFDYRAQELKRYCSLQKLDCVIEEYQKQEFLSAILGLEKEIEGGARCGKCFYLRLKKTAEKAKEMGAEYFATTLTVSPLKNAGLLNEIGEKIANEVGVKFLPSDFKKRGGYLRSIELSKQFDLYRQNYCGCEFSKR